MDSFTHLHVHSHFSLLDGLPKIPDLVAKAKEKGMSALALTDHGALYGAIEFYKTAKRAGLKPILGVEAYLATSDNLRLKSGPVDADYSHLVLLARDLEGYKNLLELVTISHLEGYYYKPRIDKDTLARLSSGLIGLSGCLRGEIARSLQAGNYQQALEQVFSYQKIFGKDSFYLEIQRNSPDPIQKVINDGLVKLSKDSGIGMVATNDAHYLEPADSAAQDILLCIGTGHTVEESNRLDMRSLTLDLKSPEEMAEQFADLPEALLNTSKIAESVDLELELGKLSFPSFAVPEGLTPETYFEKLCLEGIKERYPGKLVPEEIAKRLNYEIETIKNKGYATYFLVVSDLVNWARNRGIISTTRGSAAGSLAAYALGITTMNPVEYKLPFERFLNPYRPTPPDIDMDFADNRRDEVLQYVSEKYGKDKVAQIVTFGTMMARAAIRDVGRALGIPYSKCDRIAKMIPFGKQGFHISIEKAVSLSPELREAYQKDPETKTIIELAKKVEGSARHASVHAAGVVIAPTKLSDYTPLQLDTDNQHIITQYDMRSAEEAGLVKMDFLGIRNLSILGNAVELVREISRKEIDLQRIPLDDRKTYELLSSGRTMGVFQLGGSGMTKYLVDLKPTNIFDLMAMISLYRPGPMESIPEFIARKHNPALITYLDPRLKDILDLSYGVITYQDDVLLIAIKLASYTWEEADKLRKAMGKKIPKEMAAQKEKFIQGAMAGGMPSDRAVKLWSLIEPFAAYGFNKAHAASYAMVAYQTAYMKANYPVEFMAAVLTAESDDMDKVAEAVAECSALKIEVLAPDVNESLSDFTVISQNQIRFGLNAIKNLGSDVIAAIIAERKQNGAFLSLADFIRRVRTRNFNKKSWEALVKSGSLDRFGERNQLLFNTEDILEYARGHRRQETLGQPMLFANPDGAEGELKLKAAPPATEAQKLAWEKELLGLYVSSHPLKNYEGLLTQNTVPVKNLSPEQDGTFCTLGGIITRVQTILTKKGEQMCFADLEDLSGTLELVVFPSVYAEAKTLLSTDKIVLVRGRISDKDGEIKLLVDKIVSVEQAEELNNVTEGLFRPLSTPSQSPPYHGGEATPTLSPPPFREGGEEEGVRRPPILKIRIPAQASPQVFSKLKIAFAKYPGETPVSLVIPDREGTPREVKTNFTVAATDEFKTQLKELLRASIQPT